MFSKASVSHSVHRGCSTGQRTPGQRPTPPDKDPTWAETPLWNAFLFVPNFRRCTQQILHSSGRSPGGDWKHPIFSGEIANLKKKFKCVISSN